MVAAAELPGSREDFSTTLEEDIAPLEVDDAEPASDQSWCRQACRSWIALFATAVGFAFGNPGIAAQRMLSLTNETQPSEFTILSAGMIATARSHGAAEPIRTRDAARKSTATASSAASTAMRKGGLPLLLSQSALKIAPGWGAPLGRSG